MRLAEVFELQLDQGPGFDAYREGVAVVSESLEDATVRWPDFAPHALEHDFASIAAVPMRLRTQVIGALNLFSTEPAVLADDDLRVARAMVDIATIGILQERAVDDAGSISSQLEFALTSRITIEQAKGIVAERAGTSVDDAFAAIRGYVRRHQLRLHATAQQIVAGTVDVDASEQSPKD